MRTTSLRQRAVQYRAKVLDDCARSWARRKQPVLENDIAILKVMESINSNGCYCPKLRKGETYRVGVDIVRKTGRTWEMKVPKLFYVKEASRC
jgi:hypothetical protein